MYTFLKETFNNFFSFNNHIKKTGEIELACIFCQKIYKINKKNINIHINVVDSNNSIRCNACKFYAIIPITENSALYNLSKNEKINKLELWHKLEFSTDIQEDDYYLDEETKENFDRLLKV